MNELISLKSLVDDHTVTEDEIKERMANIVTTYKVDYCK